MNTENKSTIRETRREYFREWRKKNAEKVQAIQERYWVRKGLELRRKGQAAETPEQNRID